MENPDTPEKKDEPDSDEERKFALDKGATKIGLHSVKNILGEEKQSSLFSENFINEFSRRYGIKLENSIDRFGVNLNDIQLQVMEGLLRGFTETNYQGNEAPKDKSEVAKEKYQSNELPMTYKYMAKIPRLVATQSQILEWAGITKRAFAEKERAVEALRHLGTTQFCFYYERLALDENGEPKRHKNGGWIKEEVTAIDTLFTIKEIRDPKTKKMQYYEILPSPIFLDQSDGYFMLIPYGWREEAQKALGKKKMSSYTFRFLLFLRFQYELKRRSKQPLEIRKTYEEIAVAIKMPESVYRRKRDRAHQILDEAYAVAKALGYLNGYNREGEVDILWLREEKYYNPQKLLEVDAGVKPVVVASDEAKQLFDFFYEEKRRIDPKQKIPIGDPKNIHTRALDQLLKERLEEEIRRLIQWSLNRKYWCSRLSTPSKLREHFGEAWIEMVHTTTSSKDSLIIENKMYAQELTGKLHGSIPKNIRIELLNQHMELLVEGASMATVISYDEKGFKDQLESALRKIGISNGINAIG